MKRLTLMMAFAFISGAFAPLVSGAQERVAPFDGLASPRITLPDDHEGAISNRDMCPESNNTCRAYLSYTGYFVRNATIPHRQRELLILRTAWLSRGHYIWGRHNVMGQDAGLRKEEVNWVTAGPGAAGWSAFDAALLRAADELDRDAAISDRTWAELEARYDTKQLMDVVFTVGEYNLVSMALKSFRVQLDEGVEGFPQ